MTKFPVRALTIAQLAIKKGDVLLDLGAGTGSVSIEAALHGAKVYAIERKDEGVDLITDNARKFGVDIEITHGLAPRDLPSINIDKCFIGGSAGQLEEIFIYLDRNLRAGGLVCANFITLKNLTKTQELFQAWGYKDFELNLIQFSAQDSLGLMRAENPIFMIKGVKSD